MYLLSARRIELVLPVKEALLLHVMTAAMTLSLHSVLLEDEC